jgi:hypothetical protein
MLKLKTNYFTHIIFLVFIALSISAVGMYTALFSHAATPYSSTETESGTLVAPATIESDATASGAGYVEFSSTADTNLTAGITLGTGDELDFTSETAAAQQAEIALMKADGVHWLRIDAPGTYQNDAIVKAAVAAGINVSIVLLESPTTVTPTIMSTFASAAATHYKALGVQTFEVMNEVNGCEETMTAADYVPILKAAYTAIKAANPFATVLTSGMCAAAGDDEPYTYLTAMYADGAKGYFDAFNMHPYSRPDTPDETSDSWNPWSYLAQLHSIMEENGDGSKLIWLTEFGCSTGTADNIPADCTDSTLATQITEAYTSDRAQMYLGPLFVFNWEDSSDGDWGLYTASGAAKPDTVAAYKAASEVE